MKTNMKKDDLIRAIQTAEENFPCFKKTMIAATRQAVVFVRYAY